MPAARTVVSGFLIALLCTATIAITVPIVMRLSMQPHMFDTSDEAPNAEVAIVLGASVVNGKPSRVLEERAAAAIALLHAGKVAKILVTGDNGELTHDEVTPVRKFLTDSGVPAQDIFLDHAGFDTYSSMYRARSVFDAQSAIIVTQDFHLPRALFIARMLGLDASGVESDGGTWLDYLREIPASDKALWDIVRRRVPTYLGDQYPLTGDGETTWY